MDQLWHIKFPNSQPPTSLDELERALCRVCKTGCTVFQLQTNDSFLVVFDAQVLQYDKENLTANLGLDFEFVPIRETALGKQPLMNVIAGLAARPPICLCEKGVANATEVHTFRALDRLWHLKFPSGPQTITCKELEVAFCKVTGFGVTAIGTSTASDEEGDCCMLVFDAPVMHIDVSKLPSDVREWTQIWAVRSSHLGDDPLLDIVGALAQRPHQSFWGMERM